MSITVWTDKDGITRESSEVHRRAIVGELLKIVDHEGGHGFSIGEIVVAKRFDEYGDLVAERTDGSDFWWVSDCDYIVLEPTDIIHYDGRRYREVKRQARKGELVMLIGTKLHSNDVSWRSKRGQVYETRTDNYCWATGPDSTAIGVFHGRELQPLYHRRYVVLEPLENTPASVTPNPDRIAALEAEVADLKQRIVVLESIRASEVFGHHWAKGDAQVEPKLTRDEVVEKAKTDVTELLGRNYLASKGFIPSVWFSLYDDDGRRCFIVTHKCDFIIDREKRTVVSLIKLFSGFVERIGIAKCDPDDVFNVHIGKAIALRRALGLDVPDVYLKAPQPVEPQVGDIAVVTGNDDENAGGRHLFKIGEHVRVEEFRPTTYGGDGGSGWRCYNGKEDLYQTLSVRNLRVIDDSRDGYDYSAAYGTR